MHVISVYGTQDAVAAVEEMIDKVDVPSPNIEFTGHLVSGTSQINADDLPKELLPTARQLHGLFPYKGYRILETFLLCNRDG